VLVVAQEHQERKKTNESVKDAVEQAKSNVLVETAKGPLVSEAASSKTVSQPSEENDNTTIADDALLLFLTQAQEGSNSSTAVSKEQVTPEKVKSKSQVTLDAMIKKLQGLRDKEAEKQASLHQQVSSNAKQASPQPKEQHAESSKEAAASSSSKKPAAKKARTKKARGSNSPAAKRKKK